MKFIAVLNRTRWDVKPLWIDILISHLEIWDMSAVGCVLNLQHLVVLLKWIVCINVPLNLRLDPDICFRLQSNVMMYDYATCHLFMLRTLHMMAIAFVILALRHTSQYDEILIKSIICFKIHVNEPASHGIVLPLPLCCNTPASHSYM